MVQTQTTQIVKNLQKDLNIIEKVKQIFLKILTISSVSNWLIHFKLSMLACSFGLWTHYKNRWWKIKPTFRFNNLSNLTRRLNQQELCLRMVTSNLSKNYLHLYCPRKVYWCISTYVLNMQILQIVTCYSTHWFQNLMILQILNFSKKPIWTRKLLNV